MVESPNRKPDGVRNLPYSKKVSLLGLKAPTVAVLAAFFLLEPCCN